MIWHLLAIIGLTALTQVGGLAWALALLLRRWAALWLVFLILYSGLSVGSRFIAPVFGREAIACFGTDADTIAMLHPLYCALNRNYVAPQMKTHANALARHMNARFPGTQTRSLDANFPFLTGFPLLPHLSHDDGEKLDLAFYYQDQAGAYQPGRAKWALGYWGFTPPPADAAPQCARSNLTLRWDMGWLQPLMRPLVLDDLRTSQALHWLVDHPKGQGYKILLEPHLQARLGLESDVIRFQGCRAARHDDHIHLQFKPIR